MHIMKRNNFVTGLISVLIFVALAVYFCVYIYQYVINPYSTETAISYTVGESYNAEGIIVREESLFSTSESYVTLSARDGDKVAAGSPVATAFSTSSQQALADQIYQMDLEITQLEKSAQLEELSQQDVSRDLAIKEGIMELNYSLARGEMDTLEENAVTLKTLVLSVDEGGTSAAVARLKSEMKSLQGQLGSSGTQITSSASGIFSSNVDGYEDITPSSLDSITAASIQSLISDEEAGDTSATGKLVEGIKWYFAAVLPYEEAEKLSVLQSQANEGESAAVAVQMTGVSVSNLNMTIERVDMSESGDCVVILSCNYALGDTLGTRITEAEIVYTSYTGIRVSKEAVYLDDENNAYVFTEKALLAEQHYVTIIHEMNDYYLVKPSEEDTDPIREGSEIIVRARDLYDGKVITR